MAVDTLGRYQLSDIQDRVRRLLDAVSFAVDSGTGAESALTIQDQLISNTEIINQVNESLMGLYMELMEGRDSLFATTVYLSVSANNIGPYNFPPNMLDLRWMKWKSPSITLASVRPEHWIPMAMVSDPNDRDMERGQHAAPTWRWEGDGFVLNEIPQLDNAGGIQLNMTALPGELVNQTDTLTVPARFVRVIQQAVIYDVACMLAAAKKRNVAPELSQRQATWHQRALLAVTNAYRPESIQMVSSRMIKTNFSNRKRRWW